MNNYDKFIFTLYKYCDYLNIIIVFIVANLYYVFYMYNIIITIVTKMYFFYENISS